MTWAAHLKGPDGGALEPQVGFEVLCDFTHETLEGQLPDQQFGGLLVSPDFTQRHGSRSNRERNGT